MVYVTQSDWPSLIRIRYGPANVEYTQPNPIGQSDSDSNRAHAQPWSGKKRADMAKWGPPTRP